MHVSLGTKSTSADWYDAPKVLNGTVGPQLGLHQNLLLCVPYLGVGLGLSELDLEVKQLSWWLLDLLCVGILSTG